MTHRNTLISGQLISLEQIIYMRRIVFYSFIIFHDQQKKRFRYLSLSHIYKINNKLIVNRIQFDRRDIVITKSKLQAKVQARPKENTIVLHGCNAIIYATA